MLSTRVFSVSKACTQQMRASMQVRGFVKVGDKVPVNYVKDEPVPTIKADSEYPEWLSTVGLKGASKAELLAKFNEVGAEAMARSERNRLKRLLGLEQIRAYNANKVAEA